VPFKTSRGRDERQPSFAKGGIVFSVLHREEGQGLGEYALILSLIAMAAVFALMFIAGNLTALLSSIGSSL
jgi:Flp pilus assembly pilin Flp